MAARRRARGPGILYDETARPDEMYGHLGDFLKVIALWTSLIGALARSHRDILSAISVPNTSRSSSRPKAKSSPKPGSCLPATSE
jgi:hypothetical protein